MIKIGITGEMGSGKSHCCSLFAALGVPVFLTDDSAKYNMNHNEEVKYMLRKMISPDIYSNDGTVNRAALQEILFEMPDSADKRGALNIALYPYVKKDYADFLESYHNAPYVLLESALLYESDWNKMFDYIIYVNCPVNVRQERVEARSGLSVAQQNARTGHMMDPETKLKRSDFIIHNHGDFNTSEQVAKLDDVLRRLNMELMLKEI